MDRTILLHVAAVFNDDLSPIATDSSPGADVNIPANDDIAGNGSEGMHECGFVNNRDVSVVFVNQG